MIGNILTLFIFVVMSDCNVDNQGILLEISSGNNVCNNDKLFKNYQFSETPEFAAMCNIPVPNESQVQFLTENNFIPILCMGVYDVTLRLCSEAIIDTTYFKDVFPPSSEQFSGIFNTLKQSGEYSDLNKFCSETVKKHNNLQSISNNTKFWWGVLNNKLNSTESCKSICRTNEVNLVHPLCSYIAWSNDLVNNHRKSQEELEAKESGVPVDNLTYNNSVQLEMTKKAEAYQVLPETSIGEDEQQLPSGLKTAGPVSGANVISSPSQLELLNLELNSTKQPTMNQDQHTSLTKVHEAKEPALAEKSVKSTENSSDNNINLLNKNDNTERKFITKAGDTQDAKDLSNLTKEEIPLNPAGGVAPVNAKTDVKNKDQGETKISNLTTEKITLNSAGGAVPVDTKSDIKNKDQIKPIEVPEDTDQNDINGDFNLDGGVPSDQPIGSDPEIQQQFEEEQEDEDDEATVGDNPEKAGSKINQDSINKPHNDQGKPDEVYSEVDRTVVLEDPFIEAEDTHFFSYFLFISLLTIVAYLAFHNKNKLLALAVEGRRTKSSRRRPNSSNYSKLDCNLEEAMVSKTTASVTHVLY